MARILFVEPFFGGSHRAFADGLSRHSRHEITFLTLPGERWRERMRRGSQELAAQALELEGRFDALVASDMLDLASFLALTRRRFGDIPAMLYFHENQFTYPRLRGERLNSWFGQVNYLSALAADAVAFNSAFHRDDFLRALHELERVPTNWLRPAAREVIATKSSVLPVGLELAALDAHRCEAEPGPPIVLWSHRWEFDKEPAVFARAMERLADEGVAFRVAIAGEPGEAPAEGFERLRTVLGDRLVQYGYAEDAAAYARLLWCSAIAVSTSRQEFFGIATAEAMYCRCWPVAPARLNYPALIPEEAHRDALYTDEAGLVALLRRLLEHGTPDPEPCRRAAAVYAWPGVIGAWDEALEALAHIKG